MFFCLGEVAIGHSRHVSLVADRVLNSVRALAVHLFKQADGSKSREGARKNEVLFFLEPTYSAAFFLFPYVRCLVADGVGVHDGGPAGLHEVASVARLLILLV